MTSNSVLLWIIMVLMVLQVWFIWFGVYLHDIRAELRKLNESDIRNCTNGKEWKQLANKPCSSLNHD